MKPQTRAPSTRNAGPRWPLGWTVVARLAGIREIRHGDREDPGRLGRVDDPDRARLAPPAQHGRHDEAADRDVQPGQHAEELDARRVEPGLLLGLAQRGPQRPVAVAGRRPRGRGRRRGRTAGPRASAASSDRSMSSSSGPRSPSPKRISTADCRPAPSSGGRKRLSCMRLDRLARPAPPGRASSGSPSLLSVTGPPCASLARVIATPVSAQSRPARPEPAGPAIAVRRHPAPSGGAGLPPASGRPAGGFSRWPGKPPFSYFRSFFAFSGSVSPSPYAGQSGAIGQAPQAGLRAWQMRRPWKIDAVREHRPLALREERGDVRLDLLRVLLLGPLPAPHQPPEVGVHGDARAPRRRCRGRRWRSCGRRRAA